MSSILALIRARLVGVKSRKTTVAGVLAGVGLLAALVGRLLATDGPGLGAILSPQYAAELLAAFGAILLGLFARDDDVTSEGTKAPKDEPASGGRGFED